MTSQIESHIEYLIQTYKIIVLMLYSKLMRNMATLAVFNAIWWWFLIVVYFLGHPVNSAVSHAASLLRLVCSTSHK